MAEFKHPFNWSPAPFTVFKDAGLASRIEEEGFAVVDFLSPDQLEQMQSLYGEEHRLEDEKGGMFYTVYSQDVAYRKRIHEMLQDILQPSLEAHFENYSNALNFFINKLPGDQSGFALHQDSSAIDEFKHSALSVWMPLQNVDENNGALWLIEKTHQLFSPFRSVSFAPPFAAIKDTLVDYLQPIPLKAGQALFFDARVVHTSGRNTSGKNRLAVVSGILPAEYDFQLSYQDAPNDPIELYRQAPDFLINYPNFFHDCTLRPTIGERIGEAPFVYPSVSKEQFEADCAALSIPKRNRYKEHNSEINFITEPVAQEAAVKKNLIQRLFS